MHTVRVTKQEICYLMMKRALDFLSVHNVEIERLKGVEYEDNVCALIRPMDRPKEEGCYVHLYWNTDVSDKPVLMTDISTPEGRVFPMPGTPLAVMARILFARGAAPEDFVYWPKMAKELSKVIEELVDDN